MKKFKSLWKFTTAALTMLCVVVCLSNCSGNGEKKSNEKTYTEEEVQNMVNQAVSQAVAEAQAQGNVQAADNNSANAAYEEVQQSDNDAAGTSSPSASLKEKAYKMGYDRGIGGHTIDLSYFTGENEKVMKSDYMGDCRYFGLGEENYNNRELYNEWRRGFLKGYEDGNNAL